MAPLPVVIWACSHGTDRHHFPETMGRVINELQSPIRAPFYLSKINARPGRMLDDRFMEEYEIDFFGTRMGKPQMNVILMGGNDIETHKLNGAARFLANIQTLTGWHDNSNSPLMLCGLPPRPAVHYQTEHLANYVDSRMKRMMTQRHVGGPLNHMFRFVKTFDFFKDKDGFCMTVNMYDEDETHFNQSGVAMFCEKLYHHINDQALACQGLMN